MARLPNRSCYVLELSVQPGGSRWAELHAYSKIEHIRAWLEQFCKNENMDAYHAIWYGATLGVWVVQNGIVEKFVDVHPFIRARLDDRDAIAISDTDACVALVHKARNADDDEHHDNTFDDWNEADIDTLDRMKLELSWDPIAAQLPALEPPCLSPGEETRIEHRIKPGIDTYLDDGSITYGSYDHEGGVDLDPPFDDDDEESNGE